MQARFVVRVLSYSLGTGKIGLKGIKKRPWLEISRSEIDKTYLDHQLRTLRKLHVSKVEVFWDRISTDTYYDRERFRLQSDYLWRAYELLYPQDEKYISDDVLKIAGIHGLTALWTDQGKVIGRKGSIKGKYSDEEYVIISRWLQDYWNIKASPRRNQISTTELVLSREALETLIDTIQPCLHYSMKKKLR